MVSFLMVIGIRTGKGSGKHSVFPLEESSLRKRQSFYSVGKPWVSEEFESPWDRQQETHPDGEFFAGGPHSLDL